MARMSTTQYFEHELTLSSRSTPASTKFSAKLAYRIYGSRSNPAILIPTCYGGKLDSTFPFFFQPYESGDSSAPLTEYFVILVGLLGGSESSSPSNTPEPWKGPNFPKTTYEDNIGAQHALVTQELGIEKLHAYIGFSMGGQQAYHMSVLYPDFASRFVCLATSARTSWHNWSFLEGPKAALVNSVDWHDGKYTTPVVKGTKAFARVYSTWALSQPWFRQRKWEEAGCSSLEAYLVQNWEGRLGAWDAHDLLRLLATWQDGDITCYFPDDKGDLSKTLQRIKAKMLVMPSRTDMYFPPEDSEEEVKALGDKGRLDVIESVWGHLAGGGGGSKEDNEFIVRKVTEFLK